MQWRAAISSAIVVDRQGDHDLAMRLGRWVRRTFPGDAELTYRAEFAAIGLGHDPDQTTEADHPRDDLHAMMAEVLAITDKM
jgi:hypothetical protein